MMAKLEPWEQFVVEFNFKKFFALSYTHALLMDQSQGNGVGFTLDGSSTAGVLMRCVCDESIIVSSIVSNIVSSIVSNIVSSIVSGIF